MAYLPLSGTEICQMMNLPSDMATNAVWALHQYAIMAQMVEYTIEDAMADALEYTLAEPAEGEEQVIESEYYHYLRLAYAYLALAGVAHLLNLKTVGEGIVKTVGLESAQTSLLTGDEVEQLSRAMKLKGLKALGEYISEDGLSEMKELTPAPKGFRIGVI